MERYLALIAALSLPSVAVAQPQSAMPDDPVALADKAARERGELSQVLVLGTSHLSSLPKGFDTARFDDLIDRLAAWKPEAIAVENLSGPQCDFLREYAYLYPDTADSYCPDPTAARAHLGVSGAQAAQEIDATLATPAAERAPEQRRRLAALLIALGEPNSALVQWLRLSPDERKSDASLTQDMVDTLEKRRLRNSEDSTIAAPLAARLGHERLFPVDDHTGDAATGPIDDTLFGEEIAKIWNNPAVQLRQTEDEQWDAKLTQNGSVIDWYRAMNTDRAQRMAVESDFAAAAGSNLPGNTGRKYLAYWETRNLRMVANLRAVTGDGNRVLAIVGAAHKPYYERYLGMTSDVECADVDAVLAD